MSKINVQIFSNNIYFLIKNKLEQAQACSNYNNMR